LIGAGTATRFRVDDSRTIQFCDRFQGEREAALGAIGDVVLQRKDGVFAYQLAVVVDDADQGITDVVRGADLLLPSTAWQIELARALALPQPEYAHLPLLTEACGAKLSKSRHSAPVDPREAAPTLVRILDWLQQAPPAGLALESPTAVLAWALAHWRPERLVGRASVPISG
jgi:glutamyl-Q tRNA(Asp) synthetase